MISSIQNPDEKSTTPVLDGRGPALLEIIPCRSFSLHKSRQSSIPLQNPTHKRMFGTVIGRPTRPNSPLKSHPTHLDSLFRSPLEHAKRPTTRRPTPRPAQTTPFRTYQSDNIALLTIGVAPQRGAPRHGKQAHYPPTLAPSRPHGGHCFQGQKRQLAPSSLTSQTPILEGTCRLKRFARPLVTRPQADTPEEKISVFLPREPFGLPVARNVSPLVPPPSFTNQEAIMRCPECNRPCREEECLTLGIVFWACVFCSWVGEKLTRGAA